MRGMVRRNKMKSQDWQVKLYNHLRKTIQPLCRDRSEPYDHGMSKARLVNLLRKAGYNTEVEKSMPCNDTIDPTYVHPFSLDVYAEFKLPYEFSFGDTTVIGFQGLVIDAIAIEVGGLSGLDGTKHAKNKMFAGRTVRKKEMICSQYKIPENRYFIMERDEIFSRNYILDDATIYHRLDLKDNGMQRQVL